MALSLDSALLLNAHIRPSSRAKRNAASMTQGNAPLDEQRDAMLADLDQVVPIVAVQYFQKYLLPDPPCPKNVVQRVVDRLVEDGTIVDGRWKYWDKDPRDMNGLAPGPQGGRLLEDKVFEPFARLAEDVQSACTAVKGGPSAQRKRVHFQCNPASIPESISRNEVSKSKPDAYGLDENFQSPARWCDVVTPGEFKKKDIEADKLDNYKKILWSMTYIMQEDARRRFVIGFTIENVSMRLWFLSRSEVLVTEEFNFMTNHDTVVDFFLRMSFASALQLGFDVTMTRLPELSRIDKSVVYVIRVWDDRAPGSGFKRYRTRRLISELGAICPRGRGTRVWEVEELDDDDQVVGLSNKVLKDTWGDVERPVEGAILDAIETDAKEAGTSAKFKDHFLPIDRYGDVYIEDGKKTRTDTTDCFIIGRKKAKAISSTVQTLRVVAKAAPRIPYMTCQGPVAQKHGDVMQLPARFSQYPVKRHHRIVYGQVGTPIFQAPSLLDVFRCMGEVVQAIGFMHKLGWVHRDISYGNVLIVEGRGKVTDLEYSKKVTDNNGPRGIRTGTPFFMSHEVEEHKYCHLGGDDLDEESGSDSADDFDFTEAHDTGEQPEEATLPDRTAIIPFRYNPLHDIESLFLLCLFLLLAAEFKKGPSDTPDCVAGYKRAQDELFGIIFLRKGWRRSLFDGSTDLKELFSALHPQIETIATFLEDVRKGLRRAFHRAESDMTLSKPIPSTVGRGLRGTFAKQLKSIIAKIQATGNTLQLLNEAKLRPHGPAWKVLLGLPDDIAKPAERTAEVLNPEDPSPREPSGTIAAAATSNVTADSSKDRNSAAKSSEPARRSRRILAKSSEKSAVASTARLDGPSDTKDKGTVGRKAARSYAAATATGGTRMSSSQAPPQASKTAAGPSPAVDPQTSAPKRTTRSTARSQAAELTPRVDQAGASAAKVTRGTARGRAVRPARGRGRGRGL